jgi:hypothetical protein
MQGRSGTRAGLVYLLAGAALGAAVVIVLWIYSGGKPFGELVGTADVSPATPAAVQPSAPADRAASPAGTGAQLESEPPAVGRSRELQFKKKTAAKRTAKAKAKAEESRKKPARRKQVVRVVAPPPSTTADDEEIPVAVVPSPAPSAAPTPPPAPAPAGGGGKPVNRAPASGVGAGEG